MRSGDWRVDAADNDDSDMERLMTASTLKFQHNEEEFLDKLDGVEKAADAEGRDTGKKEIEGTTVYMAPELLEGRTGLSFATD